MSQTQKSYAVLGGGTLGLLLFYLGLNIPSMLNVEVNFHYGEMIGVMMILGIEFGYYLGKATLRGGRLFTVFTASFFATLIVTPILLYLVSIPSLEEIDWNSLISLALPFLTSFSLIKGGLLETRVKAMQAFDHFCSKLGWYIFGVHLTYTYEIPVLTAFISKLQEGTTDAQTIINLAILTTFLIVFFVIVQVYIGEKTSS